MVLAGLIYGLAEALITALLGSIYTQIVTFALVILSLDADAERPVRPRRGAQGMSCGPRLLLIAAAALAGLGALHRARRQLPALRPGPGRPHRHRRRRPQRAARALGADLARPRGLLRHRRLRGRHPDDQRPASASGSRLPLAGAPCRRRGRPARRPGAARARSLPRHGDDRLRLHRRAGRGRARLAHRRLERPHRHPAAEPRRPASSPSAQIAVLVLPLTRSPSGSMPGSRRARGARPCARCATRRSRASRSASTRR